MDHGVVFKNNECNSKKENDMKVRRNISHIFQVLFYLNENRIPELRLNRREGCMENPTVLPGQVSMWKCSSVGGVVFV